MTYNLTQLQNSTTVWELVEYANTSASGLLIGGLMAAVFFVILMVLKVWDFDKALVTSSFICFVLSSFLTYAGVLNFMYPLIFLILCAFTLFYMYVVKS